MKNNIKTRFILTLGSLIFGGLFLLGSHVLAADPVGTACKTTSGASGEIISTGACIPMGDITDANKAGLSCTKDGNAGQYDSTGNCVATTSATTATTGGLVPCGHGDTAATACTLCHFIVGFHNLIDFGLKLLVTITVVGIFISGVIYIISSGNETLLGKAKTFLSASLAGFAIVLAAWLIVNVVMWAISFNPSMSIGKKDWFTFDCVSTATTQPTQTPTK